MAYKLFLDVDIVYRDVIHNTDRSGQREHHRLVLRVGGTSTSHAAIPRKRKSPPLRAQIWGVPATR